MRYFLDGKEVTNPDLTQYHQELAEIVIGHHDATAEVSHYEILAGTDNLRHKVIDTPYSPAGDDYETITNLSALTDEDKRQQALENILATVKTVNSNSDQITDTQMALTEVYEQIAALGGTS